MSYLSDLWTACYDKAFAAVAGLLNLYGQLPLQANPLPVAAVIGHGEHTVSPSNSAVNHKGTEIILCKGDKIGVIALNMTEEPDIQWTTLFKKRRIIWDEPDKHQSCECKVTLAWSEDDRFPAVNFTVKDADDPRSRHGQDCHTFDVLFLYLSESRSLQELCKTCEDAQVMITKPKFSSDGCLLIVPWVLHSNSAPNAYHQPEVALDFYETASKEKIARLLIGIPIPQVPHFAAHGKYLAVLQARGVILFNRQQSFSWSVVPVAKDEGHRMLFGFSADGHQLAVWSCDEATLHLYTISSGVVRSFVASAEHAMSRSMHLCPAAGEVHFGFTSVVVYTGPGARLVLFSIRPDSFGQELLAIVDPREMAVSKDGIFLAVMTSSDSGSSMDGRLSEGPVLFTLQIYEMATGRRLHTYQDEGWRTDPDFEQKSFTLSWASPGVCLFVSMRHFTWAGMNGKSYNDSLEKFTVFHV